jgi:hypothetical protein
MKHRRHGIRRWSSSQEGLLLLVMSCVWLLGAPTGARAQEVDSVRITWTAPADLPGASAVSRYDVRMFGAPLTLQNFGNAFTVPSTMPKTPGARETLVVRGLVPGRNYWLAIRSADRAGNWSPLSNVVLRSGSLDTAPPAAPFAVAGDLDPEGNGVTITWDANAEADLAGYTVYRTLDPLGDWTRLNLAPLWGTTFIDDQLPPGGGRFWYAVTASDWSGNESARSLAVTVNIQTAHSNWPTTWHLLPPFPNPATSGAVTHVPIEAPQNTSGARVAILDPAGHVVRHLDVAPGSVGFMQLDWDGRNDHGVACAPGVYRAQLVAGSTRLLVRIARVP